MPLMLEHECHDNMDQLAKAVVEEIREYGPP